MQLTDKQIHDFQEIVWDYYHSSARSMPWRENPDPYWVLVSEIMLQQTQVSRVLPKFVMFIEQFPKITRLAKAPLSDVLRLWSGLGYNRRAKFLQLAAQTVVNQFDSHIPRTSTELVALPGIGVNTAGAILAYAYNLPVVFIETNIRTVYFHHFLTEQDNIDDAAVRLLLEQTIDCEHPREWYWALMDYGTYLKQVHGNNINRSRHYTKQTRFAGSRREVRGKILKLLVNGPMARIELDKAINDSRFSEVCQELQAEGFVSETGSHVKLTDQSKLP